MLRDRGSVWTTTALISCVALAVAVILAVLARYVLGAVGGTTSLWERLSFIATVVGAAFTMVAVVGIAVGVLTLRQSAEAQRLQAEQAIRATHNDLLKMAIDRPLLDMVWGGPVDPRLADDDRGARNYANMIVAFWQMAYRGGVTTDAEVRLGARYFFTGRIGRAFWSDARADRAETAGDATERRFHELVDAEYQAAIGEPAEPDEPLKPSPLTAATDTSRAPECPSRSDLSPSPADVVNGGGIGGLLASIAIRYVQRRRHGR